MQPNTAGTTELNSNYDRVNALRSAFTAGCQSALQCGTLVSPASEDAYTTDIATRYGEYSPLYRACLKAWVTGYNTTYQVCR